MSSNLWDPPTTPETLRDFRPGGSRRRALAGVGAVAGVLSIVAASATVALLGGSPGGAEALADASAAGGAGVGAAPVVSVEPTAPPSARAPTSPIGGADAPEPTHPATTAPGTAIEVTPSMLGGAQQTAFAVGLATSGISLGVEVVRQPELRTTAAAVATGAVLEVNLARAAWSTVEPPTGAPLSSWYTTFAVALDELEAAAAALSQAAQPALTPQDAAALADVVDQHLDAAYSAVADAAMALDAQA